jgi:hypothetical protein
MRAVLLIFIASAPTDLRVMHATMTSGWANNGRAKLSFRAFP